MKTNVNMVRKIGSYEVIQRTKDEKIISFYNGNDYLVKSDGIIISINFNKTGIPKELKQGFDKNGYKIVSVYFDNKTHKMKVHRLVAICFIPNSLGLYCVNHKDENKENNCIENIEWCTQKYNNNYGTRNLRISKSKTNGKTSKKVCQIDLNGKLIKIWDSANEAQRAGFNQAHVSRVASIDEKYSKNKTHKGFIWKYQ